MQGENPFLGFPARTLTVGERGSDVKEEEKDHSYSYKAIYH